MKDEQRFTVTARDLAYALNLGNRRPATTAEVEACRDALHFAASEEARRQHKPIPQRVCRGD